MESTNATNTNGENDIPSIAIQLSERLIVAMVVAGGQCDVNRVDLGK